MTAGNNNNKLKMPFTGERFTPETRGNLQLEHQHRYLLASQIVENKTILDIASGEGYGSNILSKLATHVYGVDIDAQTIEHAKKRYSKDNITFLTGDCTNIPLDNDSIDVVISFEILEHVTEHDKMLTEIKRILRKDGILVISTPFKDDKSNIQPKFHLKELYRHEFNDLLSKYFNNINIYWQDLVYASVISLDNNLSSLLNYEIIDDNTTNIKDRNNCSKIIIAIASDNNLPNLNVSISEPKTNINEVMQNIYVVVSMLKLENILNKMYKFVRYMYKKIFGK
jgi:2-polyprenyl-3-methyl-5-hydroxy-6-metoxy-1,4-benzoquinol methylase